MTGDEEARRRVVRRILFVSTVLFVGAVVIWTKLPAESLLGQGSQQALSVAGLAIVFWVSELFVARVTARTGSHSFSPSDLALMFGILVVPPKAVAIAAVAGLGIALFRRLAATPLRLFFNISQTAFSASAGLLVASWLAGGNTTPSTRVWISALAGVLAAAVLGSLAVDIAVTINDGRAHFGSFGRSLAFSGGAAIAAGSLGVLVVWATQIDPSVLALVVPPTGITFFALRASLQQRQQREELEFLYGALRALSNERDVPSGLATVANSLKETLRAKEVIIRLHAHGGWHVLNDEAQRLEAVAYAPVLPGQGVRCETDAEHSVLRRRLDGSDGCLGLIEVRTKTLGRGGFDRHDEHRLDQLADQLGVHLENSGLSSSLAQLELAEQLLRTQLETDYLTGLANRTWLHEKSMAVPPWAVVLIDLDGFKSVNDTLGHEAGDRVLAAVGKNLQALSPEGWTAVRLGGDEFAVVNFEETRPDRRAVEDLVALIEERCVEREFMRVSDVRLGASAGAALRSRANDDLDELLRRADSAMYAAKRARKNRIADAPEAPAAEQFQLKVFMGGLQ